MATPVVFNGVNYSIPAFGDVGYAQGPGNLSAYLIAIASGTLQITGGLFSLTSDANFGPNFGLVSIYYKSASANIAIAGVLRLANTDTINWRNVANTLDLPLAVNGSNQLTFNGALLSTAATNGTVNAGIAGRLSLYPAAGNTVDDVYVQNTQNIDILIAAQAARTVALEYTIPNPGNTVAAATFALLELAQTFTATQTFAAATFTGLITGVNATLSGTLTVSSVTNQIVLGTTNTVTLTSPAPAASRVYTIPDVLGAASFVMTAGAQTIGGVKTLNAGAGAITMSGSTIAMGANKITGLADGSAATDAAAFGQIPTVSAITAYTPTFVGVVASSIHVYYQQIGKMVHIFGSWKNTSASGVPFTMTIPAGMTIDVAIANNTVLAGLLWDLTNGSFRVLYYSLFADGSDTTHLFLTNQNGNGTNPVKGNGNNLGPTNTQSLDVWIPIT